MPDLTSHTARACASVREWSREFPSSDGKGSHTVTWGRSSNPKAPYKYHYMCTCWPYRREGTCKHVRELEGADSSEKGPADRCGWDSRFEYALSKHSIFWAANESTYKSHSAKGRGLLSPDPDRALEMLLEQRPDLPAKEFWTIECDGTIEIRDPESCPCCGGPTFTYQFGA
jgi:hypothetical protein